MIELSNEQRLELKENPPRVLDPLTQETYVLVSEELYERIQALLVPDGLTPQEQRRLLEHAGTRAGWDDREMEVYDREALPENP
jgi:hypothetical protein